MKKALDKEMKNRVIMTMIICGVCLVLFAVMFMQFRTIEETDITEIEYPLICYAFFASERP